ncbi:unnamed protein product [Thelazia callipaeda]|uniref:Replication termination factor 2 n=1 Tax=Thelazia callipaeda TaxID=103827 RepID=A0A0N5CU82_THECL|nr:unnamed protein product [Thelazia callipaeda]
MGADGGTIPKRCELVKKKKTKEKVDKNVTNATRWKLCRSSQEPLRRPIVACKLGNLYNKEEIIKLILTKVIGEYPATRHIKGMKDIKELKLTDNKEYKESVADKGDLYKDHNVAPFCCPVTGISMNGIHSFTVNWQCGCVISEKAIEEVKSDVCLGCGGSFNKNYLIMLNPPEEIREIYEKKLEEDCLQRKSTKASRRRDDKASTSSKLKSVSTVNSVKSNEVLKKPADHSNPNPKQLIRKAEKRKAPTDGNSLSIQNSNASLAYKSLFTTCEEAKHKPEPHWITHNPLFY